MGLRDVNIVNNSTYMNFKDLFPPEIILIINYCLYNF